MGLTDGPPDALPSMSEPAEQAPEQSVPDTRTAPQAAPRKVIIMELWSRESLTDPRGRGRIGPTRRRRPGPDPAWAEGLTGARVNGTLCIHRAHGSAPIAGSMGALPHPSAHP
ncbi:hypothetical protein Acsp03_02930 [Actinomadura sp. NBRC 104412]|nr:hypothetical protein Acsp03_02930 [Actinomadura sp. NBRC 104412]